jgi:ankyrin repeat protein
MPVRFRRISSPIRVVRNLVLLACLGAVAVPIYLKVAPHIRRQLATNVVWCAGIENRPADLREALEQGGDPNARNPGNEPTLMVAAHNGNTTCVRLLLKYGADPNIRGSKEATPLLHAVRNSHVDIVKDLLESGADPNLAASDGDTPLTMGAWVGNLPDVKLLLDKGADPNVHKHDGSTPLAIAIREGYPAIADLLRQAGARQ